MSAGERVVQDYLGRRPCYTVCTGPRERDYYIDVRTGVLHLKGPPWRVRRITKLKHLKKKKVGLPFRGCSHIMSAKNGGVQTPPPPLVSQK